MGWQEFKKLPPRKRRSMILVAEFFPAEARYRREYNKHHPHKPISSIEYTILCRDIFPKIISRQKVFWTKTNAIITKDRPPNLGEQALQLITEYQELVFGYKVKKPVKGGDEKFFEIKGLFRRYADLLNKLPVAAKLLIEEIDTDRFLDISNKIMDEFVCQVYETEKQLSDTKESNFNRDKMKGLIAKWEKFKM